MDEQKVIQHARMMASEFFWATHLHPERIHDVALELQAALDGLLLQHSKRLCACGHTYSSHHGLTGGDCLQGDCECTGFIDEAKVSL